MKNALALVVLTLSLLMTGCLNSPKAEPQVQLPANDPCMEAIKDGTQRIHAELVKLARYQQQKNYKAISKAKLYEAPKDGPLSEPVTLTWSGPIDKMLSQLAQLAGYRFPTPIGIPHFRNTIVQVDVIDTPIFKVIEDVGWQAGDRITVYLDEEKKILKLAYRGD